MFLCLLTLSEMEKRLRIPMEVKQSDSERNILIYFPGIVAAGLRKYIDVIAVAESR